MRQAGRYLPEYKQTRKLAGSFLDLCYNPKLATEVTLQPLRRFNLDGAILFSDILVIPHGLGQEVTFVTGEGPKLNPVTLESFKNLKLNRVTSFLEPVYEAVSRIKENLPDDKTFIGFCGAPWTVACYMLEGQGSKTFSEAKTWLYKHEEMFFKLIHLLEDASVAHLSAQIEAGVEVVQIFESWAGHIPHPYFDKVSLNPLKRIAERLKLKYPHVPVIVFARGYRQQQKLLSCPAFDGVGIDETQDFHALAKVAAEHGKVIQGALDNTLLLTDPETIRQKVFDMYGPLKETFSGSKGGLVANLGHGILPPTPIENMQAYVDATRDVWAKS